MSHLLTNRRILRPAITPDRIDGLVQWLDASEVSSMTFNGSAVSQWRDLTRNGRHYNQATGSFQPLWQADGINGRPAVVGDGLDDIMTCTPFASGTNYNFYVVAAFDAVINRYVQFGGFFGCPSGDVAINDFRYDASANPATGTRIPGGPADMVLNPANGPYNPRSGVPAVYSYLRNGGLYRAKWTYGAMQSVVGTGPYATAATANDRLFQNYFGPGSFRVAELVCYSRDLSDTEEASLSRYFQRKYGVGI